MYKVAEPRRPRPNEFVYPAHIYTRRVYSDGDVGFRSDKLFISEALAGHEVGLEVLDAMRVRAWFRDVDLGVLETIPEVDVSCFDRVVENRGDVQADRDLRPPATCKVPPSAGAAAAILQGELTVPSHDRAGDGVEIGSEIELHR